MNVTHRVDGTVLTEHFGEFASHLGQDLNRQLTTDASKFVISIARGMAAEDRQARYMDLSAQWDAWYLRIVRPLQANPDSLLQLSYDNVIDFRESRDTVQADFTIPFENDGRTTKLPFSIELKSPHKDTTKSQYSSAVQVEDKVQTLLKSVGTDDYLASNAWGELRKCATTLGVPILSRGKREGESINNKDLSGAATSARQVAARWLNIVQVSSFVRSSTFSTTAPLVTATVTDPHHHIDSPYDTYARAYSNDVDQIVNGMSADELRSTAEGTIESMTIRNQLRRLTESNFTELDEHREAATRLYAIITSSDAFQKLITQ